MKNMGSLTKPGENILFDAANSNDVRPIFTIADTLNVFRILLLELPVSWFSRPGQWQKLSQYLATVSTAIHKKRTSSNIACLQSIASSLQLPIAPETLEIELVSSRKWERLAYFRNSRPDRWHPEIRIHGLDVLQSVLARGNGALLWGTPFIANNLISKMTCDRVGLDLYHFSRPAHGLSTSRLGMKLINPLFTSVELKYLKARVIAEYNTADALRYLGNIVRSGGVGSITVGGWGKRTVSTSFLRGKIAIASGPIFLARKWATALLPTFSIRNDDSSFDIWIGEELMSKEVDPRTYCEQIAKKYVAQLEPFFIRNPEQWQSWDMFLDTRQKNNGVRYSKV